MSNLPRVLLVGASGYIGSRLSFELAEMRWPLLGCDIREPTTPGLYEDFFQGPYAELPDALIKGCDAVLWFAGHSSVGLAQKEPWESLQNNVVNLTRLFRRIAGHGKPVIYASSASVLSSAEDQYSLVANEVSANAYDAGKLAFDIMVPHIGVDALGLRMATVSGWSPNMRWDLVFNAMNHSAVREKIVRVQNSSSFRSLLFIDDLCTYVVVAVQRLMTQNRASAARQVALGSWSGTIGLLAAEIADFWQVPLSFGVNTSTYSFVLNDRELAASFEGAEHFYKSIRRRCAIFAKQQSWRTH
jgi:UDP-glucose 4-epimerase